MSHRNQQTIYFFICIFPQTLRLIDPRRQRLDVRHNATLLSQWRKGDKYFWQAFCSENSVSTSRARRNSSNFPASFFCFEIIQQKLWRTNIFIYSIGGKADRTI